MGVKPDGICIAQEAHREKNLKLKVGFFVLGNLQTSKDPMSQKVLDMGLLPGFGDDTLYFLGVKYTTDGSTGGRTAAFSVPYLNEPDNYGKLYNDQDVLNEDILRTAQAGLQASIHAIGDRAIESALQSIEYANAHGADTRNLRFRIEHLESPTPEQIERIKKLNIAISLSSVFIYSLGDSHISALGYDRLVDAFPAKTLMDNGILVACNSDDGVDHLVCQTGHGDGTGDNTGDTAGRTDSDGALAAGFQFDPRFTGVDVAHRHAETAHRRTDTDVLTRVGIFLTAAGCQRKQHRKDQ